MKKILLIVMLVSSFTLATGATACNKEKQKSCLHTTIETEGLWKGLKKTDMGTYIPESYDQVYERMKNDDNYFNKLDEGMGYQVLFSWDEYLKLFNEKNNIVKQSYPKNVIINPLYVDVDCYDYVNGIIFCPDMTLDQSEGGNLGLTSIQYAAIEKDMLFCQRMAKEEDLVKSNEVEIMNIQCSISEIPSIILTLSNKNVMPFLDEYLPIITEENNILNIGYNWALRSNNSQYLYVLTKDGGCISFDGKYDEKGNFQEHINTVQKKQVERIIYLYLGPDSDKGAFNYVARIVVFNLHE